MSEIVSLHIGQAGIQLGSSCWELFCLEHGIECDGSVTAGSVPCQTFFQDTERGKMVPRACFIDTEPDVVDKVKLGNQKDLFNTQHMTTGKEDTANIYGSGTYIAGYYLHDSAHDNIRRQVEKCDSFQGFFLYHAIGGGTGSGLAERLLYEISKEYNRPIVSFTVFPSPNQGNSTVEPYNTVLSTGMLTELCSATVVLDNAPLYDICRSKLDIENPSFSNVNRLIAQSVLSLTNSHRVDGAVGMNINEMLTNLVPHPTFHFLLNSYAPLSSIPQAVNEPDPVETLTRSAFQRDHLFADCDPSKGKYMACSLNYRGNIVARDVNMAICILKENSSLQFVDWCPTGFKSTINDKKPIVVPNGELAQVPRAVGLAVNSSAVSDIFAAHAKNFDILIRNYAFAHWFVGNGCGTGEFRETREILRMLLEDYMQLLPYRRRYF